MAINIKNLEERIQKKAHVVDSNTSVDDLTDMVEAALLLTGSLKSYADSSQLPAATGSNEKIGFIEDIKAIKFNNNKSWSSLVSGEATGPVVTGPTPIAYGGANAYVIYNGIGKFDMSSTTNATQIPALGSSMYPATSREIHGGRSSTHGYFSGGGNPGTNNTIRSFPFAAEDALSDTTADLTQIRRAGGLEATGDGIDVYTLGGFNPGIGAVDTVDKFPTANNSNATDVGNLTNAVFGLMPATSSTHGYRSGGGDPGSEYNVIDKFPFASGGNSTDVGDNTDHRQRGVGASSTTHGYAAGGYDLPARINIIDKYPFSSDTNATDVGDLTGTDHDGAGASSPTYGFFMGGGAGTTTNEIQRWAFASDGNASDTADLYEAIRYGSSTHDTA